MHALQEYIDTEMKARRWTNADLHRASGLSTAHISKMRKPGQSVRQMPDPATVAGLAKAFAVDENVIRRKALEAMGVDLAPLQITRTVGDASDDELLAELGRRLGRVRRPSRRPMRMERPLRAAARHAEGDP